MICSFKNIMKSIWKKQFWFLKLFFNSLSNRRIYLLFVIVKFRKTKQIFTIIFVENLHNRFIIDKFTKKIDLFDCQQFEQKFILRRISNKSSFIFDIIFLNHVFQRLIYKKSKNQKKSLRQFCRKMIRFFFFQIYRICDAIRE